MSRRWRDYETEAGRRPVKEFVSRLSDDDAAEVAAAMKEVAILGLRAARHLDGEIYEVGPKARTKPSAFSSHLRA